MASQEKRPFPLKPLLIALGLDAATFLCFYAFYASDNGNGLWLAAGIICAIASFPFYTRVVMGLQRPRP